MISFAILCFIGIAYGVTYSVHCIMAKKISAFIANGILCLAAIAALIILLVHY